MRRHSNFPWKTGSLEVRATLKGVLTVQGQLVR
jgi:hypothetical protein